MPTPVKLVIEQVNDGVDYKGSVTIDGTKLDYALHFATPLPELDEQPELRDPGKVRQIIQLTILREGRAVELTLDEYGLFFGLIVEYVGEFYNEPQVRSNNSGLVGMAMRGEGPISEIARVNMSLERGFRYTFPPAVLEALGQPKFGCTFPSE